MEDNNPTADNVRWLSYDDIADMRGIDRASAIRMARRKRWPKQEGNDGTARVAVPGRFVRAGRTKRTALEHGDPGHSGVDLGETRDTPRQPSDSGADQAATIKALSDHIATLREQLTRAQDGAVEREEQLRSEVEAAVARLQEMQSSLEEEQAQLAEARTAAAAFKVRLEEVGTPFWRRWGWFG